MTSVARKAIRVDSKLLQNALLTVAGLLLVGGLGWLINTTIEHGSRLSALEEANKATAASVQRVESDITYVRNRVDEIFKHLLQNPG